MIIAIRTFVGIVSVVIGNGPNAPGKVASAIMIALGIFCVVLSLASGTRVGAAFSHGRGPTVPISSAGRVLMAALALVLLIVGLRGFLR
jgi:hypothetical protein